MGSRSLSEVTFDRRGVLRAGAALIGGAMTAFPASGAETETLPFEGGERPLVEYPGKRKLLRLTSRPPQLETPFSVFTEGTITPNDAFFVRYHLAGIPTSVNVETFRLAVKGAVEKPLSLTLADIRALPAIEYAAVLQCSGNGRGFFEPRVAGGQAGNGLMGNARWRGVPLKAILEATGVKPEAVQVAFRGLDEPALPATPAFVKALDVAHARDGEVMVAYAMNGDDLPMLNGFPLRLIVPGRYGTYWVKHLSEIIVLDKPFDGFWMKTAYRIPADVCACVPPGGKPSATVPIGRLNVRSFITSPAEGMSLKAGEPAAVRGIAFDGGYGVSEVLVCVDDGEWRRAQLGPEDGKYAFREFRLTLSLPPGPHKLRSRALDAAGASQPEAALWNPAGYMRNVVEAVSVIAS